MHTLQLKTKHHGTIYVHHNGDWDGDVIINWTKGKEHEVRLPAELFLLVAGQAANQLLTRDLIAFLENWGYGGPYRSDGRTEEVVKLSLQFALLNVGHSKDLPKKPVRERTLKAPLPCTLCGKEPHPECKVAAVADEYNAALKSGDHAGTFEGKTANMERVKTLDALSKAYEAAKEQCPNNRKPQGEP